MVGDGVSADVACVEEKKRSGMPVFDEHQVNTVVVKVAPAASPPTPDDLSPTAPDDEIVVRVDNMTAVTQGIKNSFRQNFVPGLALWAVAATLLILYYTSLDAERAFTRLGDAKAKGGFLFSAISTCIFGGVIPFAAIVARNRSKYRSGWYTLRHGLFYAVYWFYKGVEVDALYRLQNELYGDLVDFETILMKVFTDQFIYNPVWGVVSSIFPYRWEEVDFSWILFLRSLDKTIFTITYPTTLFSVWIVWIPVVSIVYSLPSPLQIPLFNLAICFWVLMLSLLVRKDIHVAQPTATNLRVSSAAKQARRASDGSAAVFSAATKQTAEFRRGSADATGVRSSADVADANVVFAGGPTAHEPTTDVRVPPGAVVGVPVDPVTVQIHEVEEFLRQSLPYIPAEA